MLRRSPRSDNRTAARILAERDRAKAKGLRGLELIVDPEDVRVLEPCTIVLLVSLNGVGTHGAGTDP